MSAMSDHEMNERTSFAPGGQVVFFYGPPGSGKSSVGQALAQALAVPFWDLDAEIERGSGRTIPEIFAAEGEAGFRGRERAALEELLGQVEPRRDGVIALGGGALLDPRVAELAAGRGPVVCLTAPLETLLERLSGDQRRPLLAAQGQAGPAERLEKLLAGRAGHYAAFDLQVETAGRTPQELAWEIQVRLGLFRVTGMGPAYDVRVRPGGLDALGELLAARGLGGPVALVSDANVAPLWGPRAGAALERAGYRVHCVTIPAGEAHKTMETVMALWESFLAAGLERGSTVVSLGGGVVNDLAGFAAATFLRGVRWVSLPTSLLAMCDASLGGKTGADLPQGKNLVGAFHPPALVLADPAVLATLPEVELRSGLAEVVKHGVISDPALFERLAGGWQAVHGGREEIVRRAMAVKIAVIQADPFERGPRAALNLGHTIGHAVELASGYAVRHGEAVGIGMVSEARLGERAGLTEAGLADRIAACLAGLGLPAEIPAGMSWETLLAGMGVDKKRAGGKVRLAIPVRMGEVQVGVALERLLPERMG